MRLPRRLGRLVLALAVSLSLLPLAFLARVLALVDLGGLGRASLRTGAFAQRLWGRGMLFALRVQLEVEGAPPRETYLVVANHVSYLDILVLASLFPGRFVAKSEITGWPVLGELARLAGTIFVVQRRRKDVVRVEREIARTLAAGVPVLLFPEGWASRGVTVERLHSSLLETAVRARVPCLAVTLHYDTPGDPWAPAATVCWWGGMTFWPHLWNLLGLPVIRGRVRIAARPLIGEDRKRLSQALRDELLAGFRPIRQGPLPPGFRWAHLFRGESDRLAPGPSGASSVEESPVPRWSRPRGEE